MRGYPTSSGVQEPRTASRPPLYVDVKFVKVRINESIVDRAVYIIGVDLEGNKSVLDYEVRDREDLDGWKSFLGGLVSRGVSRVDVIVSDDFSGLDRVVSTLFPSSQHQLCITHLIRNLMRVLPDKEKDELMRVRDLKSSRNVEEGKKAISSLSQLVEPFSPARAKRLLDAADRYCAFLNFPREVRHYLYTNNTSESFNSTLGSRRSSEVTSPPFAPCRSTYTSPSRRATPVGSRGPCR